MPSELKKGMEVEFVKGLNKLVEGFVTEITLNTPYQDVLCTIGKLPFAGVVVMTYIPDRKWLEFEAYEQWLRDTFTLQEHTIESMALTIAQHVWDSVLPKKLTVTVLAKTPVHGDAEVTVKKGGYHNEVQYLGL